MRRGRFEQADGGTLFLDEIGDMPFDLQTRLLRVLSDGQFYRVGGHHPIKSNVRVIAATHQNLEDRVRQGVFREDLFHRLNVIRLRLPALRERREDIPTLTRFFLQKSAQDLGVDGKRISEAALARLAMFDFPGNVRQLENVCHWLTVMAPAQVIESKDLPPELLEESVGQMAMAPSGLSSTSPSALSDSAALAHDTLGQPIWQNGAPNESFPGVGEVLGLGATEEAADAMPSLPLTEVLGVPIAPVWLQQLEQDARQRLEQGQTDVWEVLSGQFEACLIHTALALTRGRRIEAAQKLGIGRNTITRKIQELGMDE